MRLYNTMSKSKEEFVPLEEGSVLLTVASLMYWWMEWSRACRM